jgi:NAD(P)-dependent dehydrogenase (short-subunit alcohol dehydrogenase family)
MAILTLKYIAIPVTQDRKHINKNARCGTVAGTSAGIGAAIVDALSESGETDIVILSRNPSSDKRTIAVGYTNLDQLQHVLEEHQVKTVICVLSIGDDSSG